MSNTQGTKGIKASARAASLIEAQVTTLPVAIAALSKIFESGGVEQAYLDRTVQRRKLKLVTTASGGNIVAEKAENPDKHPGAEMASTRPAYDRQDCVNLLAGNGLVTVGAFMQAHDMLDMRTPEFQFLGHVVDAVINDATFSIKSGYMPVASFDGLVIDHRLDGMPLFSTTQRAGFMEVGDAVALLEWLLRYLQGEHGYVSGGDAG